MWKGKTVLSSETTLGWVCYHSPRQSPVRINLEQTHRPCSNPYAETPLPSLLQSSPIQSPTMIHILIAGIRQFLETNTSFSGKMIPRGRNYSSHVAPEVALSYLNLLYKLQVSSLPLADIPCPLCLPLTI